MNYKNQWNQSYQKQQNFLFYPHEEIIRFVSKYFCKRSGFEDVTFHQPGIPLCGLDLGCGIGRHVKYMDEMGISAFGIDLSDTAVSYGKQWFDSLGLYQLSQRLIQGSIADMPYDDGFFDLTVSHGVLDSMGFKDALAGVSEVHRCLKKGGLFYFDVISGDDNKRFREYSAEEIVETEHEKGTIQAYYNWGRILELAGERFSIEEADLVQKQALIKNNLISRYHIVFRKV